MSRLVGNQFHAFEFLLFRGIVVEQQSCLIDLEGAWMFHTTVRIVGQDGQTILLKRTFDTRIALHPFHGFYNIAEDDVQLCHLLWIRLTIEGTDGVAIAYSCLFLEFSCYKRIEIDGYRVAAIAKYCLPSFGHVECGGKPCPDVGLVETREDSRSLIRQEYGIQKLFLTVECFVGAGKVDFHDVETLFQQFCCQQDMLVFVGSLTFLFIVDRAGARETTLEVEYNIILFQKIECNHSLTRYRCLGIRRNVECQVIGNITNVRFTLLGEFLRNAFFRHLSR